MCKILFSIDVCTRRCQPGPTNPHADPAHPTPAPRPHLSSLGAEWYGVQELVHYLTPLAHGQTLWGRGCVRGVRGCG